MQNETQRFIPIYSNAMCVLASHCEAITKAAATHLDLWDGDTEETENALADALDAIAWTVE